MYVVLVSGLSVRSKNFLTKVVNGYGKVVGKQWEQLGQLYECCVGFWLEC